MAKTLPFLPDGGLDREHEPEVREFATANYTQRASTGFASDLMSLRVSWSEKYEAYWVQLRDFFAEHKGRDYFLMTLPDETQPRRFVCSRWRFRYISALTPQAVALSADFQEVIE